MRVELVLSAIVIATIAGCEVQGIPVNQVFVPQHVEDQVAPSNQQDARDDDAVLGNQINSEGHINPEGQSNPAGQINPEGQLSPDNTGKNQRDADGVTKTPIDQKENQRDINVTADIRRQIVGTENLSMNARNIKVITADGKVTLRGPVDSEVERSTIVAIATRVAGEGNVDNQLEVKEVKPEQLR